jgi:mono/diheme cytochrome c family protein
VIFRYLLGGLGVLVVCYIVFIILDASEEGKSSHLYHKLCADCHGKNGEGFKDLYPPLANSDFMKSQDIQIACIIRNGMSVPVMVNGKPYQQKMPPFQKLSIVEITNLMNFIMNSWGNQREFVKLEEVKRVLESCQE